MHGGQRQFVRRGIDVSAESAQTVRPVQTWKNISLVVLLALCVPQLLSAQDESADSDSAAAEDSGGFFDLFGRKIQPDKDMAEGSMPEGELKIVVDKNAPRFGSKRRSSRSRGRTYRKPLFSKKILWSQKRETYVNSGGSGSGGEATHLVKSGGRVYLRSQ